MTDQTYNVIKPETGAPIKAWTKGSPSRMLRGSRLGIVREQSERSLASQDQP